MRIGSFLSLLCLFLVAAAPAVSADPLVRVLYDFEDAGELAQWQVRSGTLFTQTRQWSGQGHTAASITFQQWRQGAEQWPAIVVTRAAGTLPVSDFTPFDALQLDAHNPQPHPVVFSLQLRDADGKRFTQPFSLKAHQTAALSVPVETIRGAVDAARITELHCYNTRPAQSYTVYLDNVRLSINLVAQSRALAAKTKRLAQASARATLGTADSLPPVLSRQLREIRSLASEADRFAATVRTSRWETTDSVTQARATLQRLENETITLEAVLPRLQGIAYAHKQGNAPFLLLPESSMRKVFLEAGRLQPRFTDRVALAAARNEHESFQAIIFPLTRDLTKVTWSLSPLRQRSGAEINGSVRLVGYVNCKPPSYPVTRHGWWPDPLLDFQSSVDAVPQGEVLPLWVTVDVPENAAAGIYHGTLTVTAAGVAPQSLAVQVEVWDFAIPKQTHLRTALSWRPLSPKLYPAAQIPAMTKKYEDWLLREYHLNPGSIYDGLPQWNVARLRELKAMGLNAINLCYLWAPTGKEFNADAFWKKFAAQLDAVAQYLRVADEAGVRDRCYIYCFDERPTDQLDVVFEAAAKIHQRFPDIPVMTTAYDRTFGMERANGGGINIWVPLTPHFDENAARIAAAQGAGRDVWWYICIGPQHPYANWFVEYPALEARLLMGAMAAKYQPGGFLYYALNRWLANEKVITGGPRTDWNPASYKENNGDGSILCAGPNGPLATIRLENIRDGIEDYEYYLLLRQLLQEKGKPARSGQVPSRVVTNLTTFTEDPAVLLTERQRLAREIVKLQRAR